MIDYLLLAQSAYSHREPGTLQYLLELDHYAFRRFCYLMFWGVLLFLVVLGLLLRFAYRVTVQRIHAGLKQQLAERGFTAEEIVQIVESRPGGERRWWKFWQRGESASLESSHG